MKLSAKSRYALAALIYMGRYGYDGEIITILSLSEKLGISKIYLEQVFSLLKRGGVVVSMKGAQGGYHLARSPREISVYDVFSSVELSLFETTDKTVADKASEIETAMQNDVFAKLDEAISETLGKITLDTLAARAGQYGGEGYMYYL
ncbi:MAG: Rrf2 family transcriptional regulator [Oscillospiraceae bacterium]|jgi:Rrf2 family protein|nr:Rrf2 family transcriptional regulator [Oscillospiraceae bacterium]